PSRGALLRWIGRHARIAAWSSIPKRRESSPDQLLQVAPVRTSDRSGNGKRRGSVLQAPSFIQCAARFSAAQRAYLVLGGDGWTLRDYFTSVALGEILV